MKSNLGRDGRRLKRIVRNKIDSHQAGQTPLVWRYMHAGCRICGTGLRFATRHRIAKVPLVDPKTFVEISWSEGEDGRQDASLVPHIMI
jgi:hypothetical protein